MVGSLCDGEWGPADSDCGRARQRCVIALFGLYSGMSGIVQS
jgi:hypothetical protein